MMIVTIYEYDTKDGVIWSPNGSGITHHGKDCPRLSALEVRCERINPNDFLKLSKVQSGGRRMFITPTMTRVMTG